MRRTQLIAVVVVLCAKASIVFGDNWYVPSKEGCVPHEQSPKDYMDIFDKRGIKYSVTDSGGAKPDMVMIKSEWFRQVDLDSVVLFRSKKICDEMAKAAEMIEQRKNEKYK